LALPEIEAERAHITLPNMETPDPILANDRTLSREPRLVYPNTLQKLPHLFVLLTDKLEPTEPIPIKEALLIEPRATQPITERELPNLPNLRSEKQEPRYAASNALLVLLILVRLLRESELPMEHILSKEHLPPDLSWLRIDRLLPIVK
jgi:hypothetical protein